MKILKRITKNIFYRVYQITPNNEKNVGDLSFACDGRIIRSLSESKKKACGTYILNGIKH